jgi:hypothetical protein
MSTRSDAEEDESKWAHMTARAAVRKKECFQMRCSMLYCDAMCDAMLYEAYVRLRLASRGGWGEVIYSVCESACTLC